MILKRSISYQHIEESIKSSPKLEQEGIARFIQKMDILGIDLLHEKTELIVKVAFECKRRQRAYFGFSSQEATVEFDSVNDYFYLSVDGDVNTIVKGYSDVDGVRHPVSNYSDMKDQISFCRRFPERYIEKFDGIVLYELSDDDWYYQVHKMICSAIYKDHEVLVTLKPEMDEAR